MKKYLLMIPLAVMISSCAERTTRFPNSVVIGHGDTQKVYTKTVRTPAPAITPVTQSRVTAGVMPKATAFKLSGNYAGNVAITLNNSGDLVYFPDPSDISDATKPVSLGGGWYLNTQGIGQNSYFTKYTFSQYARLSAPPSPEELKKAIIHEARITEFVTLPFSVGDARANIPAIKEYLKSF